MQTIERKPFMTSPSAASRYFERWRNLQEQGIEPVVVPRSDTEHWQAWLSYYRSRSLWGMLELMQDRPAGWTVPTLDPGEFEIAAMVAVKPDKRVRS